MTRPEPEALAEAFREVIAEWLSPEDRKEIDRRNRMPEYAAAGACATHDFCDANVAMAAAWERLTGKEFLHGTTEAEDEQEMRVWGEAWDLAVRKRFAKAMPSAFERLRTFYAQQARELTALLGPECPYPAVVQRLITEQAARAHRCARYTDAEMRAHLHDCRADAELAALLRGPDAPPQKAT